MLNFALLIAISDVAPHQTAAADCPAEPASEALVLDYDAFDTDSAPWAWRTLFNRGCVDAAIASLSAYRAANARRLTDEQREELSFHIGQVLAMTGRETEAVPYLAEAMSSGSPALWSVYVEATLAFVQKDRARLERAAATFEKLARPSSMRLLVVRGLLRCYGRPYRDAMHCGMRVSMLKPRMRRNGA